MEGSFYKSALDYYFGPSKNGSVCGLNERKRWALAGGDYKLWDDRIEGFGYRYQLLSESDVASEWENTFHLKTRFNLKMPSKSKMYILFQVAALRVKKKGMKLNDDLGDIHVLNLTPMKTGSQIRPPKPPHLHMNVFTIPKTDGMCGTTKASRASPMNA